MRKKKILFCCFAQKEDSYLPTDIGYVVAILQQKLPPEFEFEIVLLNYERYSSSSLTEAYVRRDADLIKFHRPDAVFFFVEDVLWSKVYALGRAIRVIERLRTQQLNTFIGIQSYKIQQTEIKEVLEEHGVDCVISGNPEGVFLHLKEMLAKMPLCGVEYDNSAIGETPCESTESADAETTQQHSTDSLDIIPSPYLTHVFDNYIQAYQSQKNNSFCAFLVSSRGCRFGCYYCFRSTKFSKVQHFSAKRFYDELEYLFNEFHVHNFFILDDAFLYSKARLKEFEAEFARRIAENPRLVNINLSVMARPETVNEEIMAILHFMKVRTIQFGLQTVNPDIQHYMRRTMDVIYFKKIRGWLQKYNMHLSIDIVTGLPGDTVAWMKETLRFALLLDPSFVQIKQFYIGPDTLFHANQEKYGIEIEKGRRDLNSPYVVRAKNIDDTYFTETNDFIMKQIETNPETTWRYITKNNFFFGRWADNAHTENKHD